MLREAFRVLKPGGRFAVSDVVVRGEVPEAVRKSMELWVGCVAGALHEDEYKQLLADAGFADVDVEPWRIYSTDDAKQFLGEAGLDTESALAQGRWRGRQRLHPCDASGARGQRGGLLAPGCCA